MKWMNDIKENFLKGIASIDFSREFVIDALTGKRYTYNDIFAIAIKAADQIEQTGRDTLAIMDNSVEMLCLLLASSLTNHTIACVDPQKGNEELEAIMEENHDRNVVGVSYHDIDINPNDQIGKEVDDWNIYGLTVQTEAINRYQKKDFFSPYLITYTSGTSGNTKGVIHSLGNLMASAYSLDKLVPINAGNRLFHTMPMTYMAGILNSIIYPLIGGASIIIGNRFSIQNASLFWKNVSEYNADFFWLSPSMLKMIMTLDRTGTGEEYCLGKNLTFLVGTAALPEKLRQEFNEKYKVNVLAGYGLSETLFVSMETHESISNRKQGSVGVILDDVSYTVRNGELLIAVPWMFLNYTNEDTSRYFDKKYYMSGDLVCMEDKQLYITGRKKDLIIKGGMNISPKLIEDCILTNSHVSECAVFAVKDADEERICCAYVYEKGDCIEKELKKIIAENLGRNYTIDYYWQVPELIRNLNGKVDKKRMSDEWRKNHVC